MVKVMYWKRKGSTMILVVKGTTYVRKKNKYLCARPLYNMQKILGTYVANSTVHVPRNKKKGHGKKFN